MEKKNLQTKKKNKTVSAKQQSETMVSNSSIVKIIKKHEISQKFS